MIFGSLCGRGRATHCGLCEAFELRDVDEVTDDDDGEDFAAAAAAAAIFGFAEAARFRVARVFVSVVPFSLTNL